jgi:hypothetical protein
LQLQVFRGSRNEELQCRRQRHRRHRLHDSISFNELSTLVQPRN